MIEGVQRMIKVNDVQQEGKGEEEPATAIGKEPRIKIHPVAKRHWELETMLLEMLQERKHVKRDFERKASRFMKKRLALRTHKD